MVTSCAVPSLSRVLCTVRTAGMLRSMRFILPVIRGYSFLSVSHLSSASRDPIHISRLRRRALIRLSGDEAIPLLQALVTHDLVSCLSDQHPTTYAHFLNVQGRVMCDTLIHRCNNQTNGTRSHYHYLVECDINMKDELMAHIKKYRLRKKVDVNDVSSEYDVLSVQGIDGLLPSSKELLVQSIDPRVRDLGWRVVVSSGLDVASLHSSAVESDEEEYHEKRCRLGVCEGVVDLPPGKALPLESNLDYMNGVSFSKGCYLGQELTARTHFTGVTRKRIVPLEIGGEGSMTRSLIPPPESTILNSQGKSAGKLRSGAGRFVLGLLRLSYINDKLTVVQDGDKDPVELTARQPQWWH